MKIQQRKAMQSRRNLQFIGGLANGLEVYDRMNSHIASHSIGGDTLREALSKIQQVSQFEKHVVNMKRVVGLNSCVSVTKSDKVVLAVRKNRLGPTPMVLGREPEPCESVVIILKKVRDDEGEYFILITAFVGEGSEPEPWDKQLVPGSLQHQAAVEFWRTHALIYDADVIDHIVSEEVAK